MLQPRVQTRGCGNHNNSEALKGRHEYLATIGGEISLAKAVNVPNEPWLAPKQLTC
ncbi:hypothetical protein RMSM_03298 [Rhodopirellula maiorica SM1]|uniref:Uncharacterized protein n=1 Tax=Rhodopirellula maiorica SM1 TaxID=1265738 RepID=M5RKR0_9BACT|nr:hypothetical protein RMSM_03298 [Rhodopirellula maiorica SM1]